jgi:stage V sporulation protein B
MTEGVIKSRKNRENGLIKGAAWIAAGGFIAKIIGAIYRIPLTNLIGGKGLGLYQMVYPVYCLLLTVSATGIPSSIAKLTAERIRKGQSTRPLFLSAMKLFVMIGVGGTVLMAIVSPFLAKAQGSGEVIGGYYALAPSVLLVSAISVFRGYFQGKNDMMPTALSEIAEQIIKVAFGILFAYLFKGRIAIAVTFLLLAVSLSELFTLFLMLALYRREGGNKQNEGGRVAFTSILRMSIPVTFLSLLIPLSTLIDSVLATRLLGVYEEDAVTLYGLFSGGAVTIIGLPVSVCYGIAAASIPRIAAEANGRRARKKMFRSLGLTIMLGGVSALGLYVFAEPAVRVIFRSLTGGEKETLVRLVQAYSISALTLSCAQTLAACLTAQGKPQYAAFSMLVGVIVKTVSYYFWLKDPEISVFGLAYATNLCYLVAFLLDFMYNLIVTKRRIRKEKTR